MTMGDQDRRSLDRFHALPRPLRFLRVRVRLFASIAVGLLSLLLLPRSLGATMQAIIAWDITVAIYLVVAYVTILRTDVSLIRRHAIEHDDGRFAILFLTSGAALACLIAILVGIGAPKNDPTLIVLAIGTIVLSWVMVHTTFAFHYAHDYYRPHKHGGLSFPGEDKPDYWDFIYFSFVIGMTAQVSDVAITDRSIRRTATAHGIISFVFNTTLLALMVNIAAGSLLMPQTPG